MLCMGPEAENYRSNYRTLARKISFMAGHPRQIALASRDAALDRICWDERELALREWICLFRMCNLPVMRPGNRTGSKGCNKGCP